MNCPPEVKSASFIFDYKGVTKDDPTIGYGMIYLKVETHISSFLLKYNRYWVFEVNDLDTVHALFAESLIEEDYIKVWDNINIAEGCWKKKSDEDEEATLY